MPRVKIDGVEHDFPAGINVLEGCSRVGVYIPHFCYHPALTVVGSCRMCKVEVIQRGRSRIDISCNVTVADGLEILTDSEGVRKQRQMTLEYLLANHPLDCPVCDDAGECDLQNFYLDYGKYPSRQREPKIRKHKATDIGEHIVLDSERCVLCSRCVRFLAEVTKTNELGIFGMGSTEELAVRPGARVDNDYSGNIVDLCPVGALTDKDFRFKRRVWYLQSAPSVCQLCSRGCNVRIDYDLNLFHTHKRDQMMRTHRTPVTAMQRIQRIKPRENGEVNGHWICDHGRYGYRPTDAEDRLAQPLVSRDGVPETVSLADGIGAFAKALGGDHGRMAVVVSPQLTNEELFAVWALFRKQLKLSNLDHRLPIPPEWYGDDLLRTPDPFPNRMGCEWIGIHPTERGFGMDELKGAVAAGRVDTLVSVLADPRTYLDEKQLNKLKRRLLILRNLPAELTRWVDVALPAASWGEYRGTFTNFAGRVQRLEEGFPPFGESLPVWRLMHDLAAALKKPLRWKNYGEVFDAMAREVKFFSGLSWDMIGEQGVMANPVLAKAAG